MRQVRETVRFADSLRYAAEQGVATFFEIGPDSTFPDLIPTQHREPFPRSETLAAALGHAFVRGIPLDWRAIYPDADTVPLPTYPFQRTRYWLDTATAGDPTDWGLHATNHPLLGASVALAEDGGLLLTGRLSLRTQPWLADHAVNGQVLFPATAFVELVDHAGGDDRIEELTLHAPLRIDQRDTVFLQVTVSAADENGRRAVRVHSRLDGETSWAEHATGMLAPLTGQPTADLTDWPPAGAALVEAEDLYAALAELGYRYGPAFRGLRTAWATGATVHAEVELPDDVASSGFGLHPALLDAALHAMGLTSMADDRRTRVPFLWRGVSLHATGARALRARLTPIGDDEVSVELADPAGRPVATIDSLVLRPVAVAGPRTDGLHRLEWLPVTAEPAEVDLAEVDELAELGDRVPDVVLARVTETDVHEASERTLALLQTWLRDERFARSRLAVMTRDTIAGAAVQGMVRSAQTEHPDRFTLIETAGTAERRDVLSALASGEQQVRIGAGEPAAPRIAPVGPDAALAVPDTGSWRLEAAETTTLDDLTLVAAPQAGGLTEGQVRIRVRAAGLNFRDVLIALGMYPGAATIGSEAAGVVVEVADGVSGLRPGDRVFGMFADAIGSVATADQRMVAPIPAGWSFARAASVPVAFLTAYYGLVDVAGVRPGESVLVHAAAGGVGMAAVQLAQHLGAEVFGTAGQAKWDALHALGLDDRHVASSRELGFGERFPRVDVVVNSLTGEFTDTSLRLLADGGRCVELGKTDLRDPAEVARVHPGVSYQPFDLVDVGPERIGEILRELVALFATGALRPLPLTAWDVRRAPEAFRFVSQARQVGKVVLTLPRTMDPEGTVLITGGTGALGGEVARHLLTHHEIRHVVLAGRTVGDAPDARITVAECDVTDRDALATLIAGLPRLTGVVHLAGVVDDGTVETLTPQQLDAVLRAQDRRRATPCTSWSATSTRSCCSPPPPASSATRGRPTTPRPTPHSTRSPPAAGQPASRRARWRGVPGSRPPA